MWMLIETWTKAGEIKRDGGGFMRTVKTLSCLVTRLKEGFCDKVLDGKTGFTGKGSCGVREMKVVWSCKVQGKGKGDIFSSGSTRWM